MSRLYNIVSKIFTAREFQINEVSEGFFYAKKGDITIAVFCKESSKIISKLTVQDFLENIKDQADRRIFITNGYFEDEVLQIGEKEEILFWDKEKLEREIGKTVMMTDFDIFIPEKQVEEIEEIKEIIESYDGEILLPKILKDKAEMIAKKFVHPISYELNLVPYYIYDYQCEFIISEGSIEKTAGTIGINGVTKFGELWFNFNFAKDLEIPYKKINPNFDINTFGQIAKKQIIELNTRSIESTKDSESVVIVEKKKIRPKPENIKIEARGMVYLPLWIIEGPDGKVVLDAINGEVSDKKLYEIL